MEVKAVSGIPRRLDVVVALALDCAMASRLTP